MSPIDFEVRRPLGSSPKLSILSRFVVVYWILILVQPGGILWGAQGRIEGQVSNGTTRQPVPRQEVRLLAPREGMQRIATTLTDAIGHFVFPESQIDSNSFYLLETEFAGAPYHAPAQFDSSGTAKVNFTIYESSRSVPGLRIGSARLLVRAEGLKARVQEGFAVENTAEPPRAFVNPAGTFRFRLTPGAGQPKVFVVGLMNMPLPQTLEPGKSPGEFSIHYPMKPGVTVVILSYETDYTPAQLELRDQVSYPIDKVEMWVSPTTLSVNSAVFKPAGVDTTNGVAKFEARNLPARASLEMRLAGEAAPSSRTESGMTELEVKSLPNSMTRLGLPLLGCFLLVLLWALGVAVAKEWPHWKKWRGASPSQKELEDKVEAMLNSLADLDELFDSGKMADKKYWKERQELKAKLGAILKTGPTSLLESYATRRIPR